MGLGQFIAIAVALVGFLCVVFWTIEQVSKEFEQHHGTPPPQPNEDDPDFMEWVERQAHHDLED